MTEKIIQGCTCKIQENGTINLINEVISFPKVANNIYVKYSVSSMS